jgi:hypothetical protein
MMSAPAYVTSCIVTVSGADMEPITLDVPLSTGEVSGAVSPGERRFDVVVETDFGVTFTGSTTVALDPGPNGDISIELSVNSPPTLEMSVSNASPKVGEPVTVSAVVTDLDVSDTHTFEWDGGGGSISGSGASVTWVGDQPGDYTVSVTVDDGYGGVVTQSVGVSIINTPPVIQYVKADTTKVVLGDTVNLSCTATDADSDQLTYSWSDGLGWSADGPDVTYTVTDASNASITFTCEVNDGNPGGTDSGTVTIGVSTATQLAGLFADANLANCVSAAFPTAVNPSDVVGLLNCTGMSISNLSGIQYLTELTDLYLANNLIVNILPLSSLAKLTFLNLDNNHVATISPLSSLTGLVQLKMQSNNISNVTPLAALTNLTLLDLPFNSITTGVSSLTTLTSAQIYLSGNIGMSCSGLNTLICGPGHTVVNGNCALNGTGGLGTNVEISLDGIGNLDTPTAALNCT